MGGSTRYFCALQQALVRSLPAPVAAIRRCDPNEDGALDVSDAIWIVNQLFLGAERARCRQTMDCNGDAGVDLSDAIYAISFRFLGENPPPEPFVHCGIDPNATPQSCPPDSYEPLNCP